MLPKKKQISGDKPLYISKRTNWCH